MDFSWVDAVLGGGLLYGGQMIGAARSRVKHRRPKDPEPVCGCTHHFSMHDENGACLVEDTQRTLVERGKPKTVKDGYNGAYTITVYEHEKYETRRIKCACRKYTGPEPLPQYIA